MRNDHQKRNVLPLVRTVVLLRHGARQTDQRPGRRRKALHLSRGRHERGRQLSGDTTTRSERRWSGRGAQKHRHAAPRDHITAEGNHLQAAGHHQRADHKAVPLRISHKRKEVRQRGVVGERQTKHDGRCSERSE